MKTITIKGNAESKIKPTTMIIDLTIKGNHNTFDEATNEMSKATSKLKDLIIKHKVDREQIKTRYVNIDSYFETYEDKNGRFKKEFKGYNYKHSVFMELPIDNKLLGDILYDVVHLELSPEFIVTYSIKDDEKEQIKQKVIADCVKNARERAKTIVEAAKIKLGDIISVTYSDIDYNYFKNPVNFNYDEVRKTSETYDLDIVPDDLTISDFINVVWEIK